MTRPDARNQERAGEQVERIAEVLAEHGYRNVLGDYEVAPYYKHFGCSCGWEQNIAGMSGYWSWVAAHEAHVAEALVVAGIGVLPEAEEVAPVVRGWVAHPDGSRSDVQRWVKTADGDWVSLDSNRRTSGDIMMEVGIDG